jgi:DNA (cytosine-5)-methyltransferase 3A
MKKNIISLFDGMSCGQLALQKYMSKEDYNYFASEINKGSINVTKFNFPNTNHIGDVREVNVNTLSDVFLVMGGSPCTDFSIAGSRKGMVTTEDLEITTLEQYLHYKNLGYQFHGESYLFWEFVRIVKQSKCKYFFLENVLMKGKNKKWELLISKELGVQPIYVNSGIYTGQNRERLYWTNIPGVVQPTGEFKHCSEVIPNAIGGWGSRGKNKNPDGTWNKSQTTRKDGLVNCLTKSSGCRFATLTDGTRYRLTIEDCEQFQGVPIGYTKVLGVTMEDRYHMLGNGWTIPVIEHFFSFIPELKENLVISK